MTMQSNDFGRPFVLTVAASGHVFVHANGKPGEPGTLPVFSTDTEEEARGIIVYHCRLERDRSGLYRLNDWKDGESVEALGEVSDMFREHYAKAKRVPPLPSPATIAKRARRAHA